MKHGKKYMDSLKKYDPSKAYDVPAACQLVKDLHYVKFDETVELSVTLKLEKNQTVRDTLVFPHQFTAEKRVLVFCKEERAKEALDAGATYAGPEYLDKVKGGWLDFDVAVATPDMMKDVGRLGPILGRRGLMPNPKTHTVTFDIKEALAELNKGRVEFRADKTGVVHLAIGKVSMDADNGKGQDQLQPIQGGVCFGFPRIGCTGHGYLLSRHGDEGVLTLRAYFHAFLTGTGFLCRTP
ncbi:MAG: 50S ribosomal protein L1, partial [Spirochaetia bacterium]|nr:50S ribosomal protein L1 [Spirochaetia bacterium]